MPRVSLNILTKNRSTFLPEALISIKSQSFSDYEVVIVNDGSSDETELVLNNWKNKIFNLQIINHQSSIGITQSRQEALLASRGEYVAVLDDDDEWIDANKIKKQVEFLEQHPETVLVGGCIKISDIKYQILKMRPQTDWQIRKTMLFKNNFFTSTVMFRREAALKAGGFVKDQDDFAEDYDLWLRMGKLGKMYNFQEAFTKYRLPDYNKEKYKAFLYKQLRLISEHRKDYPLYWFASTIMRARINFTF